MSRRPPGPVLTLGSRLYAVSLALQMPVLLLGHLGLEIFPHRPDAIGGHGGAHLVHQLRVAGQLPRLDERGHDADVGGAFLGAFGDRAHAVTDFEVDVPEKGDDPLDHAAARIVGRGRHQDQDVDVGMRVQLAAAVAAHRRERPAFVSRRQLRTPHFAQDGVDEFGARVHQRLHRLVGAEALDQLGVGLADLDAKGVGGVAARLRVVRQDSRAAARARCAAPWFRSPGCPRRRTPSTGRNPGACCPRRESAPRRRWA